MLMATLFGSLRLGARVWEHSGERHQFQSDAIAVRNFLQQRLEEARPLTYTIRPNQSQPIFAGEHNRLTLATSMPASVGPGMFLLDLKLRRREGYEAINDLILEWRPLLASDSVAATERVLMEDVETIDITYFGEPEDGATRDWHDRWQGDPFLPELIHVNLQFPASDRREWPPLIVSPTIDK